MGKIARIGGIATAVLLAAALAVGWMAWRAAHDSGPRLASESAIAAPDRPDEPPVLVTLRPGVEVESGAPSGWSDLVVKSVTFLDGGDLDTLPSFAKATALRFRTVVVADVGREPGSSRFRLRRVGAGLALAIDGRDTTITSGSVKEQGVQLGTIDGLVLIRAERALGRSRLAAATPTFALYETFVEMTDASGVHRPMNLYYALLVDPDTGRLRSACWTASESPGDRVAPETMNLLSPGLIFRCGIHVAARRVVGNFAASWGFAMTASPPGETIPMPTPLRDLAGRMIRPEDAPKLEAGVREAMKAKE